MDAWGLTAGEGAWLTSSAQIGFIFGTILFAVLNLADLLMMLSEVEYRESETALSRKKFNRHYRSFLKQLTKKLDHRISDVKHDIPRDVHGFWSNVRTRFDA